MAAGDRVRIGNVVVRFVERVEDELKAKISFEESAPELVKQEFEQPFTPTFHTTHVFPDGTRLTLCFDEGGRLSIALERPAKRTWLALMPGEVALFDGMAVSYRANADGTATFSLLHGGSTQAFRFGSPVKMTVLDALEGPDGSLFGILGYGPSLYFNVKNGNLEAAFDVSVGSLGKGSGPRRWFDLGAMYGVSSTHPDDEPLRRFDVTIEKVPDKKFRFGKAFSLAAGQAAVGPGGARVAHVCVDEKYDKLSVHHFVITGGGVRREVLTSLIRDPPEVWASEGGFVVKLIGQANRELRLLATPATVRAPH
jgi:hypothetical protein